YISDRYLPDKAIDLIDEAGSKARLQSSILPPELKEREEEIDHIGKDKDTAIASQEYEKAARLRDKEKELRRAIEEEKKRWREKRNQVQPVVSEEDIAHIVSKWTGIPATRLTEDESEKLLHMEDELHLRIISQDEAITAVSQAIRRSRTGLKDPRRPIGSFIFLGPTGVGKTELARALAEFMFGDDDALIRIDMSEFMEKFSVSRLIGAPPGYVGYEEGGQLTEQVRRKPYSVVLLDEIEKAHPDVFNLLLQILDDGLVTDNLGHKVNFKNTVIIMTSNVGARLISKGRSLGFVAEEDTKRSYTDMKTIIMEEVKRSFNPEFLNRLDAIIVFQPLTREDMKKILELMLGRVTERMIEQGIELIISSKAKEHLVEIGFDPKYGARPLQRILQRSLEDPIAETILAKKFPAISSKDRSAPAKKGEKSKNRIYVDFNPAEKRLIFSNTPFKEKVK
ncbi:MAG: AAA domain-containing protein, partial [Elusimicrobia bacterium]|nr:AAA domain-containing protein [Elusimicrobiota bacterium]MBD3412015.1 AAA domain-containing protein [Elusimicrobiota bacterium]